MEPVREGALQFDKIIELGLILTGNHPGRASDHDITFFYHAGGLGVCDMPVAALLYRKAKEAGLGTEI